MGNRHATRGAGIAQTETKWALCFGREYTLRLLNAMASYACGRTYILEAGGPLLLQLVQLLKGTQDTSSGWWCNVLAIVQKLSLNRLCVCIAFVSPVYCAMPQRVWGKGIGVGSGAASRPSQARCVFPPLSIVCIRS